MKNNYTKIYLMLFALFFAGTGAFAQGTKVSGTIKDEGGEPLIGVNILVKGTVTGTITNLDGQFELSVSSPPPITLVFTSIGYEPQELSISNAEVNNLNITMNESVLLGQEVVVSASRVEESILRSPVSIEKMDILAVQNTASDNYYKAIANLKGVDVATSSINFQIINARGFASTGNTRFVQLTDGMDTQAPALNFPIGNLNGPSELDVESLELIPGASSALYGPNAFNGILLVNSKSPFEYQGASAFAKVGVNHVGSNADQDAAPLYEFSARYAKAFNNKLAFKLNISYMKADDWHGTSTQDRLADGNPFSSIGGVNPGADRVNIMGDEGSLNLNILRFSRNDPANGTLGWETSASITAYSSGATAWQYAQNGFLPNHVVAAPGYEERHLVDYGAENFKANGGLYYRINDKLELSYLYNGGFGTSIYTGAQRYSLKNFSIQQHRLQLRGDNFFVRAYSTIEDSGDSYIAEFLALKVNDSRFGGTTNYLTTYPLRYLQYLHDLGYRPTDNPGSVTLEEQIAAHEFARNSMDSSSPIVPGSDEWNALTEELNEGVIPIGPKFNDQSALYHGEFQYDFKNQVDFMELMVGASIRQFALGSNGTIFPDTTGNDININEYGAYLQAGKRINDALKLSGSVRFDKNENFDGQVNPRISAVYTVGSNHNFRGSFQTGFRNPTTQGQYISLDIVSARLLGGLPQFYEFYDLTRRSSTNTPLAFTGGSVQAFRNQVFTGLSPYDPSATSLLEPFTVAKPVQPEKIRSFEFGYKSLIGNKLLVDAVYYYNTFQDFITQERVVIANELTAADAADVNAQAGADLVAAGDPQYSSILNGSSTNTFQVYTNVEEEVTSQGAAIGLTYSLPKGYTIGGNYNWNTFNGGFTENQLNDFNTPEHKMNLKFANRKVTDRIGFALTWRWQDEFRWESSFGIGDVPAYSTLDAQISYRMKEIKSVFKLGGSNILNQYYNQSIGGPNIGAIYYFSVTFDELMN